MSQGVSVVIPSTGSISNLNRLIPSVLSQNLSGDELQILVIFNGITDESFSELKKVFNDKWPSVEALKIHEKGVNRARNAGLARARQPFVMFLDDDCELHENNLIKKFLQLHDSHPGFFAIGGGYVLPKGHGLFDEVYNYIQMNWFVCGQHNSNGVVTETQYLLGGNFCLKRDLSEKYQLEFEPGIQYGGSELDFFKKATKAGLKLGATEIDVTHNTHESFFSVGRKVFKQGRGKHFIDEKFGNDNVVSQTTGGKYLLLRRIYSYWFWAGYFGASGKPWKLLFHIIKEAGGYLNSLRFSILKKLG